VLDFRDAVRAKLVGVYDEIQSGSRHLTRSLARTLMMTLEHEGFHVEVRIVIRYLSAFRSPYLASFSVSG
jgi:hypothetical protein